MWLVGAALALAPPLGCGGGGGPPAEGSSSRATAHTRASSRPPLCARLRARATGRVGTAAARELSGLALSRGGRRVLWTHNDSGDSARVFALAPNGRTLAEVALAGAANVDWEDIAIGPARGAGDAIYVGDIGDNLGSRPEIVVYRAREPRLRTARAPIVIRAAALRLRYPDGPHDAEALLVDPRRGGVVIVTKSFRGVARVYSAAHPSAGATTTLRRRGRIALGLGAAVTAGSVAGDGRTIALRTYDEVFAWSWPRRRSLAAALRRRPCRASRSLLREGQGEALALTRDGRAFYTVPEGRRPLLRRYDPLR